MSLNKKDDKKYSLESAIHSLIVPLGITSDDVEYSKQNLWLIDERLTYHYYLASDKHIKKGGKEEENKRADLAVFNKPLAFAENDNPFQSIVIMEFKRPQRNDYTDKENPIVQVINYLKLIYDGKGTDRNGRPIIVNATTRYYVYIICDITEKIHTTAKGYSALQSPDKLGYFWYNSNYNAYIEIMSFDKVLNDSKKRNRILFEKLGLSDSII
ncbi:hypothetical protein FACS1894190_15490 [Spirochaetia bacterium]|nr:hypothetical protein FACS1894190_15490 [Spirochaetia bacterium]